VESCCRQHGLPPGLIDDIVSEAAARLPSAASLADLVAVVDDLVRTEADRCGRRSVAILSPRDGVPALLPAFLDLSDLHPRPRHLHRALGSAAVAMAKRVLDRDRFFLFFLAWIEGEAIGEMLASLRLEADDGRSLQRRLRRLSKTIELALLAHIEPGMPRPERIWLRATVAAPRTRKKGPDAFPPPDATSWATLMRALDRVIHTRSSPRTIGPGSDADAALGL
jgi:hypothetical protein